jgi:hypothetical protein
VELKQKPVRGRVKQIGVRNILGAKSLVGSLSLLVLGKGSRIRYFERNLVRLGETSPWAILSSSRVRENVRQKSIAETQGLSIARETALHSSIAESPESIAVLAFAQWMLKTEQGH